MLTNLIRWIAWHSESPRSRITRESREQLREQLAELRRSA